DPTLTRPFASSAGRRLRPSPDGRGEVKDALGICVTPIPKGTLTLQIAEATRDAVENSTGGTFHFAIANTDRTIGARMSGDIARRNGDQGMGAHPIELRLSGSAGQSLGAWNAGGLNIVLDGEANDGVGKGMAGGRI